MKQIAQALNMVVSEYNRRITRGANTTLQQVGNHLSALHGKLLRPSLVLLTAATANGGATATRRTLLLATAVEMLHNASLLHDDVIDNTFERRHQPSANAMWGNRAAILTGDYHLAQIMQIMDEVDDRDATRRLTDTVLAMTTAELLQLETSDVSKADIETYRNITCGKTARLMATCCAFGNPAFEQFGLHYGMAFQLRDDLDDNEDTPHTATMLKEEVSLALTELDRKENNVYVQELRSMTNKLL
ncbi:MAG: polyprenyl synthetase family protein [Bacteroidales bacterium]|nr:polyprenyl synthetase family protein [Bacteroidales bacterium]